LGRAHAVASAPRRRTATAKATILGTGTIILQRYALSTATATGRWRVFLFREDGRLSRPPRGRLKRLMTSTSRSHVPCVRRRADDLVEDSTTRPAIVLRPFTIETWWPIIKAANVKSGRSPTFHQFQFRESRHVRVMNGSRHETSVRGRGCGAKPTPAPTIPTRTQRFFSRERYTNLVDRMHHDNCVWIISRRSWTAAAKLLS